MTDVSFLEECPLKPGMGSITGNGVLGGIKGSKLSPSEIFLRETVQNSYDAVQNNPDKTRKTLNFTMRGFQFTDEQYKSLVSLLSGEKKKNVFFRKYILPNLSPNMFNIEVFDSDTIGLIGDVEPTEKIGDQNFTNFVYFTGNDKMKATDSGGSYGFGKAALYAYSKARTIVIYTRVKGKGGAILSTDVDNVPGYESRFIVVSNDERISDTNSDRCWWGRLVEYTDKTRGLYARPIRGSIADKLAIALGMTKFGPLETGTSLLVLNAGPKEMPRDISDNAITMHYLFREYMPKYIVHWYWNQIHDKTINFSLILDDQKIQIDSPEEVFPYRKFIDALDAIKNTKNRALTKTKYFSMISQDRPKASLGYLGIVKAPPLRIRYGTLFDVFSSTNPVVAYMRGIGHIVYYEKISVGNTSSLQSTCYGVFCVNRKSSPPGEEPGAIDRYFRQVENQTHDKWIHDSDVSRFNYLKTVTNAVKDMMLACTESAVEEVKAANISIIIQRTLGAKLMQYDKNIGGATPPQSKPPTDGPQSTTKNTLTFSGVSGIKLAESGKIVSVQYKASVKEGTKIKVNSVVPKILTLDNDYVIDDSVTCFQSIEYHGNTKNPMTTRFTKLPMELTHSLTLNICILCHTDCKFDLDIDWVEIGV